MLLGCRYLCRETGRRVPNPAQVTARDQCGPSQSLTVPRGPDSATPVGSAGAQPPGDAVRCGPPSQDGTVLLDGAREGSPRDGSCPGSYGEEPEDVKGGSGGSGSAVSWHHVFFSQSFALHFNGINDYVEVRNDRVVCLAGDGQVMACLAGDGQVMACLAGDGHLWPALPVTATIWPALLVTAMIWCALLVTARIWPALLERSCLHEPLL